ncbi:putative bifunctional diguanylate cyclase/phosphodiesterase [Rugamonas sp. DEMB1]|uniref:putative bifunctional diguanylate cyclase/phosphodiesterase n=1 Tax=Rugamonas sp. DEMB1 TaxID=3039386 RepID=UPI002447AF93|nr:EAL domain-containing protein [Rugamonas sp. DEMB1]WGG51434.1 EAL domain-containing protein [Rugamonas sp. DEMB1]
MRLAEFITNNIDALLEEWQNYARTISAAEKMDPAALRDHARQMLEWIAADLASPQTEEQQIGKSRGVAASAGAASGRPDTSGRQHGAGRFGSGFSIEDVVAELRALRASVLRLWKRASPPTIATELDDMTRFNEALDQELTESVASYTAHKDQQVTLLQTILSASPDHSCVLDRDGRFLFVNKSLAEQYGLPPRRLIGKSLFELGLDGAADLRHKIDQLVRNRAPLRGELSYPADNGKAQCYEYILTPVLDREGEVEAIASTARNITERKAWDERIWRKANFDALTGLPNRSLFRDRLEQELKHSERNGVPVALLFIDLDHFKEANDKLGHDAGDTLLQHAAERIRSCLREKDTVARLGGDEFTAILTDIGGADHVQNICNKILGELARPFAIGPERIGVSGSIGVTLFPQDATSASHLLRGADRAMYAAKNNGGNQSRFFARNMHKASQLRYRLIADLRQALPAGQLRLYYQPIVELVDGGIRKAEALLRWSHPQRGLLPPAEFIGLAEEIGLINQIGDWVFTEAAAQARRWGELLGGSFQVSVNKSSAQFAAHAQRLSWAAHMRQLGQAGNSVSVEFMEGVLTNVSEAAGDELASLHQAGIELAVDHFGAGASSIATLKKFDVDYLKIDRSFLHDMAADAGKQTILETMIAMAHRLGLRVIAEGVETAKQRDWLREAGADYAQGFLFSEPVPAEQFSALLGGGQARH